jgi:hypothetical protein
VRCSRRFGLGSLRKVPAVSSTFHIGNLRRLVVRAPYSLQYGSSFSKQASPTVPDRDLHILSHRLPSFQGIQSCRHSEPRKVSGSARTSRNGGARHRGSHECILRQNACINKRRPERKRSLRKGTIEEQTQII